MKSTSPPPSSPFTIAVLTALAANLGCGAPPAATTPRPVESPNSPAMTGPSPRPPQVSSLTPEQRTALATKLRAFGSGWALENLEKRVTLAAEETPSEYAITLTARGASGLRTVKHLLKDTSGLSGERLSIPEGTELTPAQRSQAESILTRTKALWLRQPAGHTGPIDTSRGLDALVDIDLETVITGLAQKRILTTRARDGFAVLYLTSLDRNADLFVVEIDLVAGRIADACWQSVPPNETGMISPEDIALIDTAMRKYGDFGVYGNVTAGLVAMSKTSGIVITPTPTNISVALGAEGGHDLSFTVDRKTGKLEGVAAGHSVHER